MVRILLVHWKEEELAERRARLEDGSLQVVEATHNPQAVRRVAATDPPDAIVIDLTRLPAQGRDMGCAIRQSPASRAIPLVFAGGKPGKVEGVRQRLPDATFVGWDEIGTGIGKAIADAPASPVVPPPYMESFAGTPLPKKLGIKPGAVVALVGAPDGFEGTLGELPKGVSFRRRATGGLDLILWFVRSAVTLRRGIKTKRDQVGRDGMWIAWPKKGSALASDLTQQIVRQTGLGTGLVDYKICKIDETWSALKFTRKNKGRS